MLLRVGQQVLPTGGRTACRRSYRSRYYEDPIGGLSPYSPETEPFVWPGTQRWRGCLQWY
eukprot:973814-Rhodomonas_salina.3